jgi:hypothetical protein
MERLFRGRDTRVATRGLFKFDHPRVIDRYIDYFGGHTGQAARLADDVCGEGLLDALVSAEPQAAVS